MDIRAHQPVVAGTRAAGRLPAAPVARTIDARETIRPTVNLPRTHCSRLCQEPGHALATARTTRTAS